MTSSFAFATSCRRRRHRSSYSAIENGSSFAILTRRSDMTGPPRAHSARPCTGSRGGASVRHVSCRTSSRASRAYEGARMIIAYDGAPPSLDGLPLRSRHTYEVSVGPELERLLVDVLIGVRRRPCLALVAGVHGNEYEGMVTLAELVGTTEPGALEGSLIVVPVANPFAFSAGQRRTPQDDRDLNRVFPGSARGTLSERLAHRLCTAVLGAADFVFTLHSAMADGVLSPWLEFLEGPSALERATF